MRSPRWTTRRPVVTSKERPWTEAENEEEAKRVEAEEAKTKRLALEREQLMATIKEKTEKAMARVKESAQKNQTARTPAEFLPIHIAN
jgi:uncharacterized protein YdaT